MHQQSSHPSISLAILCAAHDPGRSSGLGMATGERALHGGYGAISHQGAVSWCPQEQLSPVLGTLTVRVRDDMINMTLVQSISQFTSKTGGVERADDP